MSLLPKSIAESDLGEFSFWRCDECDNSNGHPCYLLVDAEEKPPSGCVFDLGDYIAKWKNIG